MSRTVPVSSLLKRSLHSLLGNHLEDVRRQASKIFFFLLFFSLSIFVVFLPLPPHRGQPAVIMPTLLAPQQGMTCPCMLERCWIQTQDCMFHSLVHYHRKKYSLYMGWWTKCGRNIVCIHGLVD